MATSTILIDVQVWFAWCDSYTVWTSVGLVIRHCRDGYFYLEMMMIMVLIQ